ncbi:MAG: DUF3551 domain-containing protein [Proteobacteria bacterium]|nr:DUF3551 domain-containing protein [Pseudomonadota bacterium]
MRAKYFLPLAAILVATMADAGTSADAAQKWCGRTRMGSVDCGYHSLRQCRAGVSGHRGTCFRARRAPGVPVVAPAAMIAPAARTARWCVRYRNGASNCGFTSLRQCRATASGVRGNCVRFAR